MSADAYGQAAERGEICGIPREAVAFAAGIHSATERTWEEIAMAIAYLGFGAHPALELENAVGSWCIEKTDALRGREPIDAHAAMRRIRGIKTGGYEQ